MKNDKAHVAWVLKRGNQRVKCILCRNQEAGRIAREMRAMRSTHKVAVSYADIATYLNDSKIVSVSESSVSRHLLRHTVGKKR